MMLKKFHGKTIDEARKKAQRSLGPSFIVVETKESRSGEPAWIHVLDEDKAADKKGESAGTYSRRDMFPKAFSKLKETVNDSLQLFNLDGLENSNSKNNKAAEPSEKAKDERFLPYSKPARSVEPSKRRNEPKAAKSNRGSQKDINMLANRLEKLERMVSKQVIGAGVKFVSHPAFQQLLANGVPYSMITAWFNELVAQGIDPFNPGGDFPRQLAGKVRNVLNVAATKSPAKFIVFEGSAGSGKSSLIMKLALHPEYFGNSDCALLSVMPAGTSGYYPPLEAFAAEHDMLHFKIQTKLDWDELQSEFSSLDYVLIEMPAAGRENSNTTFSTAMLRQALSRSTTVEVHSVVNAALNQQSLMQAGYQKGEKNYDYLDFTHIDAAPQKGNLLPLMQASESGVRYMSSGPQVPDDITTFEPAQFARQLLSNHQP